MTYRRAPDSIPEAITAMVQALGSKAAAEAAGVSESRLRQLANPMRNDWRVIETLVRLETAAGLAGHGTPLTDLVRARLIDAGALVAPAREGRARFLELAVKAAVAGLKAVLDGLEAALITQPQLIEVRA